MMLNRKKKYSIAVLFIISGIIIGLAISSSFDIHLRGKAQETPSVSRETIDVLSKVNDAMTEVVDGAKPAVVNISSKKTLIMPGFRSPFSNDPFFRRFFGDEFGFFNRPRKFKQSGLGSGVIVDTDGYILTYNHVIKDAEEITVKLSDRREFEGKVIEPIPRLTWP